MRAQRPPLARGKEHAAPPRRARFSVAPVKGTWTTPGSSRSDRRSDRGQSRATFYDQRSCAQGSGRSASAPPASSSCAKSKHRHHGRRTLITQTFIRSEVSFSATAAVNGSPRATPKNSRRAARGGNTSRSSISPATRPEWAQVASRSLRQSRLKWERDPILQPRLQGSRSTSLLGILLSLTELWASKPTSLARAS